MNVFRQGNSLKKAFCCLQAQKNQTDDIDVFIFARSDTFLMNPIDIPCHGLGDDEMWVAAVGGHLGVNENFAVAGRDAANVYANMLCKVTS